jgi:TolB protein
MKKLTAALFYLSLILPTWVAPALGRIDIDITSAELRKVVVAVPYMVDSTIPGKIEARGIQMADLLGRALEFHGFISVLPADTYGGGQENDWLGLGAEFAVLGKYAVESDSLTMELRLVDIGTGRMVLGRRYRGSFDQERFMILKFADEIILKLTGEKGVSQTSIAFVTEKDGLKEIFLADILGDNLRQITRHRKLAVSPRFTPDGKYLSYNSYHRGNPNLYLTELAQDQFTRPISRRSGLNMAPAWHPDGKTMAITLSTEHDPDLYLMDREGLILERLTREEGINVSPSWSPDGTRMAFVSDRSGSPQIYVMDMKTRAVKRITFLGNYNTTPAWSPKGDLIAYSGNYENQYQIYVIAPDGTRPTRLTQSWGDHESPSWSPDGRQIVFSRKRNGEQKICAVHRNGGRERVLFDWEGEESMPQWSPRTDE